MATQQVDQARTFGVTKHDPARCYDGYTLFSVNGGTTTWLIDMKGEVVHSWQGADVHLSELLPNGHLLYGQKFLALAELDWHGNSLRTYGCTYHHDFAVLPDGNWAILCGIREKLFDRPDLFEGCAEGLSLEPHYVLIVDPRTKRRVWQWWAHAHVDELRILGLAFPRPIDERSKDISGDLFHTNTMEVLPDTALGRRDRRFRAGNILLSYRQLDTICIADRDSGYIVWAWGPGELDGQHQPTLIPDTHPITGEAMPGAGHILVFDNGMYERHTSRVIEVDPLTNQIVWSSPEDWYSWHISGAQRLPNGNTLICDGPVGRLFEITAAGETVWEFWSPFTRDTAIGDLGGTTEFDDRLGKDTPRLIYRATRYPKEFVERLLREHGGDCA